MANSNSQRVAAFMLALLFLLTTVGAAGYVIYELNSEEAGLVADDSTDVATPEQEEAVQENSLVGTIINDFSGPVEVSELRFDTLTEGSGEVAAASATVTIHYTGALASDGTIFDSSVGRGEPATFPLDNLIVGWQEGIPGMKVGETRRLFIPSDKGYGEAGSGANIPPNSDLIFDIELLAVTNP